MKPLFFSLLGLIFSLTHAQAFELDFSSMNDHRSKPELVQFTKEIIAQECSGVAYRFSQVSLVDVKVEDNIIDQGYEEYLWFLTFDVEYSDWNSPKRDQIKVVIFEDWDGRAGGISTYRVQSLDSFSGIDDDPFCL